MHKEREEGGAGEESELGERVEGQESGADDEGEVDPRDQFGVIFFGENKEGEEREDEEHGAFAGQGLGTALGVDYEGEEDGGKKCQEGEGEAGGGQNKGAGFEDRDDIDQEEDGTGNQQEEELGGLEEIEGEGPEKERGEEEEGGKEVASEFGGHTSILKFKTRIVKGRK